MIEWLFSFALVFPIKALAMLAVAERGMRLRTLGDVLLVQCFLHPALRFELTCKGLGVFLFALPLALAVEVASYHGLSVRRVHVPGVNSPKFEIERLPLGRIVPAVVVGGVWQMMAIYA